MENIQDMRKRHNKEIEVLQGECKHLPISDWIPYMWAPGHYDGYVKVCEFCGKEIKRK